MDPITATIMTLIGTGVSMAGKYQAGQAAAAGYKAQADTETKIAAAEQTAAQVTEYAGGRAAEQVGLRGRAAVGRQVVEFGAGNIGGATPEAVKASQIALNVQDEREVAAKYGEEAYQQKLTAAEKVATAGRYTAAAEQAPIGAMFDVAGTGFAGIGAAGAQYTRLKSITGSAGTVDPKWYG